MKGDALISTIDNLIIQSYFLFEMVIVDDGSNDSTNHLLLNKYNFKSIPTINHRLYKTWDCCL